MTDESVETPAGQRAMNPSPAQPMTDQGIMKNRLGAVVAGLLLALALSRLVELPARPLQISVLGSPLGVNLSETTLSLLIVVGLAVTGMQSLLQLHPSIREARPSHRIIYWIIPTLLSAALLLWLRQIDDLGAWTLALAASAVLLPLALLSEYKAASLAPPERGDAWLQWGRMVLIHLIALLLFAVIYGLDVRRLAGGPAVWLVTTLLGARFFWGLTGELRLSFMYGAAAGLATGVTLGILNVWQLSALRGGWLLLVSFYLAVGLLKERLAGRLDRRVALEYAAVGLLALLIGLFALS